MMKRGQVWIETVIYTLIGLGLIGLVLALITPKINEYRDKAVIEQTISSLNLLDSKLNEALQSPGNTRVVEFRIRKGSLFVDSTQDLIFFELEDSSSLYSQPNQETRLGKMKVLTTPEATGNRVRLTLSYGLNITYNGVEGPVKQFSAASIPYRFSLTNKGFDAARNETIDIRELTEA